MSELDRTFTNPADKTISDCNTVCTVCRKETAGHRKCDTHINCRIAGFKQNEEREWCRHGDSGVTGVLPSPKTNTLVNNKKIN